MICVASARPPSGKTGQAYACTIANLDRFKEVKQMCSCVLGEDRTLTAYRMVDLVCAKNGCEGSREIRNRARETHIVCFIRDLSQTEGLLNCCLEKSEMAGR